MHRVWDLPGLTEKQEEQIDELTASMRKEMRGAQKQSRKLHEELNELIKSGAGDAEIAEKVDQAAQVHAERMKKQALLMRDIAEVLTEEQREALFGTPDGPPHRGRQGKGKERR
jgi:Spy/CpxP family protein refolding chaperone